CFSRIEGEQNKPLSEVVVSGRSLTPGVDGAMLTGDKNLSHGIWVFQYQVTNAQALVETVGDAAEDVAPVLQRIAEGAILRTVASRTVEEVLLEGQSQVAEEVRARVQHELNDLGVGVEVVKVAPELIEPRPVRDAFLQVTRAQNEKQSRINEANAKAAEILTKVSGDNYNALLALINEFGAAQALDAPPEEMAALQAKIDEELGRAGGQVAVALREARSRANAVREQIGREYEEFTYYLEQYRDNPQVTTIRLWVAMLRDVLGSKENELFFVPEGDEIEVIVNRDPQRAIEAEQERYKRQME
ncbi:MAG: hypothetical protein JXO22_07650, partial [Phycisphaerae bacterium]|nr:hypothetical protein [Phycisphaerae bacterium]